MKDKQKSFVVIVIMVLIALLVTLKTVEIFKAESNDQVLLKLKSLETREIGKAYFGDINGDGNKDIIYTIDAGGEPGGYLYVLIDHYNQDGSAKIFSDIAPFLSLTKLENISIYNNAILITVSAGGFVE